MHAGSHGASTGILRPSDILTVLAPFFPIPLGFGSLLPLSFCTCHSFVKLSPRDFSDQHKQNKLIHLSRVLQCRHAVCHPSARKAKGSMEMVFSAGAIPNRNSRVLFFAPVGVKPATTPCPRTLPHNTSKLPVTKQIIMFASGHHLTPCKIKMHGKWPPVGHREHVTEGNAGSQASPKDHHVSTPPLCMRHGGPRDLHHKPSARCPGVETKQVKHAEIGTW